MDAECPDHVSGDGNLHFRGLIQPCAGSFGSLGSFWKGAARLPQGCWDSVRAFEGLNHAAVI